MPDKKLLQDKLHEFYELLSTGQIAEAMNVTGMEENKKITQSLPDELKSSLPTVEEIEAELGGDGG
jgi:hypothetical protein